MLRHKYIDRVCCVVLALTLLLSTLFVGAAATGRITEDTAIGYETRLFDQSRVHTIDIVMQDWDAFLQTCTSEEYASCHLVIDGESYKNVAIRGKGNTSLSNVASYGNNRYSFKVEFDHYQTGHTYHGLDKLSLNNVIQDNTYMKDYFAYTLMNQMGVAAPLCSFVQINVNGEPWGLYLAVEGVEDSFLQRNYGKAHGELYKPDSMSFGGGRGNGRDFNIEEMAEEFGFSFGEDGGNDAGINTMPTVPGEDFASRGDSFGGSAGGQAATPVPTATTTPVPTATSAPSAPPAADGSNGGSSGEAASSGAPAPTGDAASSGMPAGGEMPAMPEGGEPPADFDPNQMPGSGGQRAAVTPVPATNTPSAPPASSATPAQMRGNNRSERNFGNPGGGFGGFGSNPDVKLQYTDDDPASYSNIFNNAKTDISAADQARLIASLKALGEGDTSVVDTDAVIRYMAVHNFLCNDDSYTGMMVHNYYLYEENGVLAMIPWDYNLAYATMSGSNATSAVNTDIDTLVSGGSASDRPMAGWIMSSEEYMAQYHAAYQEFITNVFDSGWFASEIDRVTAMIDPYVQADPTAFCTYEEFQTGAQILKSFCLKRAQSITNQLNGDNTRVDASELTLSDMGTMGNMGGGKGRGGFEMPDFGNFNPGNRTQSAAPTGDAANPALQMPNDGFGGSFGGQAVGSTGIPAETPTDIPAAVPTDAPANSSAARTERPASSFNGNFNGMVQSASKTEAWLWVGGCILLLAAALVGVKCSRTNR